MRGHSILFAYERAQPRGAGERIECRLRCRPGEKLGECARSAARMDDAARPSVRIVLNYRLVMPLTLQILQRNEEFSALEPHYRALLERCGSTSFALMWEWLDAWRAHFLPRHGAPFVLTVWEGEQLAACLPLYELRAAPHTIGFFSVSITPGASPYPEYTELLVDRAHRAQCVSLIGAALRAQRGWRSVLLGVTSPDSGLSHLVQHTLAWPQAITERRALLEYRADLTGGFESFLQRLPTRTRQQARRTLRGVDEDTQFHLVTTRGEAQQLFTQLITLHQHHWRAKGKPGAFASEEMCSFHRDLIERLLPKGEAILARLDGPNRPLALLYGFVCGGTFYFYQSGVSHDGHGRVKSPGVAAHLALMRALSQQGIHTYDFLAGESEYKRRLATSTSVLLELHATRVRLANARTLFSHAARTVRRFTQRARQSQLATTPECGSAQRSEAEASLQSGEHLVEHPLNNGRHPLPDTNAHRAERISRLAQLELQRGGEQ